jgi:hypothetical protein
MSLDHPREGSTAIRTKVADLFWDVRGGGSLGFPFRLHPILPTLMFYRPAAAMTVRAPKRKPHAGQSRIPFWQNGLRCIQALRGPVSLCETFCVDTHRGTANAHPQPRDELGFCSLLKGERLFRGVDALGWRCHVVCGLVAEGHDENQLLRVSVPSGDH